MENVRTGVRVAVGSRNPVKVAAVAQAFKRVWPDQEWEVNGVDVVSGVSDQPMSDEESIRGARNRATRALEALDADYGVGLEGGLQQIGAEWFDCGWIVVVDREGREGAGATVKMIVPEVMLKMIHEGKELGEVIDIVFERQNSKQAEGHFGLMTKNILTRTSCYSEAVVAALARFIHVHLFPEVAKG